MTEISGFGHVQFNPVPDLPKQEEELDHSKQFAEAVDKLSHYLSQNPLECTGSQREVHQTLVAILEPDDFGSNGDVGLVVKLGPGRSEVGILAREVTEVAGLHDTVPRAAELKVPEVAPPRFEILTAPNGKKYACQEDDVQTAIKLKQGQLMVMGELPMLLMKQEDRSYKTVPLQFIEVAKGKLIPDVFTEETVPQELIVHVESGKPKATFELLGDAYKLRYNENWDLLSEETDLDEIELEPGAILWQYGSGFVPKELCEPLSDDGLLHLEGCSFHVQEDRLAPAKQVPCLIQEKIEVTGEVTVSPSRAFQKKLNWEGLIDSTLMMVLICPQDAKVTRGDTNFLAVANDDGTLRPVLIDTDEAFPANNEASEAFEEHKGKDIAPLRPGLLALDKTGEKLAGAHLSHARSQLRHISDKKTEILEVVQGKLSDAQIQALQERIDRMHTFLQEHLNTPFSLEEIVFAVFPKVKAHWDKFHDLPRDVRAERVGFMNPDEKV